MKNRGYLSNLSNNPNIALNHSKSPLGGHTPAKKTILKRIVFFVPAAADIPVS
jgi:hypothetical protein